jgi:branched-chain amino acid transport system substrate-binding protein
MSLGSDAENSGPGLRGYDRGLLSIETKPPGRMPITRRRLIAGSAAGAAALGAGLARPAIAASEPIRIGWLPALTGPSSSSGIATNRGTILAVNEINAAGGVNGRQIELITRDTQSDPTKAVNAAVELMRQQKVHVIWGPGNSGEALAATPLIARTHVPHMDGCWADAVVDVEKYKLAFRCAPSNQQVGAAANHYVVDVLKITDVAVLGDTTGYGTASVEAYVPMLKAKGANVVYQGIVETSQPDLKPEMLRMRDAGAKVIMPWSVNAGLLSRIMNTRGQMGWDVPIAGQTALGSGQTKALLEKPEYWKNVCLINFRSCSYDEQGKLPARTAAFVERLHAARIDSSDTLLSWIANGYDVPYLVAAAVQNAGSEPDQMAGYWNTVKAYPGVFGDYTWSPQNHNGYPDAEVVMCQANSFRDGTFRLAPGYAV